MTPTGQGTIKDYLGMENARNKHHADLYVKLIQLAYGDHQDVLVGHHLNFETHGDIDTINEIPSADTLIFDHEIMSRVFPDSYLKIMALCAACSADSGDRERIIESYLKAERT